MRPKKLSLVAFCAIAAIVGGWFLSLTTELLAQSCPAGQTVMHVLNGAFRCISDPGAGTLPTSALPVGAIGIPVAAPAPSTSLVNIGQAFGAAAPYVDAAVNALITAVFGWLAWMLKSKWGIEVDKHLADTLQSALQNRAASLVADGVVRLQGAKVDVHSAWVANEANDLLRANPDVAARFGLTPESVAAMIVNQLPHVPAVSTALAGALVKTNGQPAPAPAVSSPPAPP